MSVRKEPRQRDESSVKCDVSKLGMYRIPVPVPDPVNSGDIRVPDLVPVPVRKRPEFYRNFTI